ncbi:hypothetical protein PCL_05011 [Purpureocillium lilacinum]|uniref:Uncharacterized protein n=1 Tax=Purpureocillium lilacinum TaxID=33203 RepID=A0A2U3DWG3_PURLI|nr:hypothetical protein PCL_05011 [Purpureocillium lilacinum]
MQRALDATPQHEGSQLLPRNVWDSGRRFPNPALTAPPLERAGTGGEAVTLQLVLADFAQCGVQGAITGIAYGNRMAV